MRIDSSAQDEAGGGATYSETTVQGTALAATD